MQSNALKMSACLLQNAMSSAESAHVADKVCMPMPTIWWCEPYPPPALPACHCLGPCRARVHLTGPDRMSKHVCLYRTPPPLAPDPAWLAMRAGAAHTRTRARAHAHTHTHTH